MSNTSNCKAVPKHTHTYKQTKKKCTKINDKGDTHLVVQLWRRAFRDEVQGAHGVEVKPARSEQNMSNALVEV